MAIVERQKCPGINKRSWQYRKVQNYQKELKGYAKLSILGQGLRCGIFSLTLVVTVSSF